MSVLVLPTFKVKVPVLKVALPLVAGSV